MYTTIHDGYKIVRHRGVLVHIVHHHIIIIKSSTALVISIITSNNNTFYEIETRKLRDNIIAEKRDKSFIL